MLGELLGCGVIVYLAYRLYKWPSKLDLPGPTGFPILGNLLQLDRKLPHVKLGEWTYKYGGIYTIRLMSENWVILGDYEHIHQVLVKDGLDFAGRPTEFFRINYISQGRGDVFFQTPGENFWNTGRKVMHRSIKQYSSGMKNIEEVIQRMLSRFVKKQKSFEGRPHDPTDAIYNFTVSNLLHFSLGRDIDETDELFGMAKQMERTAIVTQSMTGRGTELDMFPWLRFCGNWTYSMMKKVRRLQDGVWAYVRPRLVEEIDWSNPKSVMEALLVAEKNQDTSKGIIPFTEKNVQLALIDILIAGTTTSSHSVLCLLLVLLHYPEVMRNMQKEVDDVVGADRPVGLADREDMPYTRAVVFEVLRFSSIVPLSVPHSAMRDTVLDGAKIPKGTTIITNLWHLHHDEKFWDAPWEFKPERFLDEAGQLLPPDHPNRKHLMPFGAGTRVCVGEIFALTRLFLFTGSVMQNFDILPNPDTPLPPCDPRKYILGIALCPSVGNIRMVPRA